MTGVSTKLFILAFLVCLMAFAGPIAPCPTASVAVYEALTGPCQVGSLLFSDFAYTNSYFPSLLGPVASAVLVTPSSNPGDPGLDLSAAWTVSGSAGMDSALTYLVTTVSGAPTINQATFGITDDIASQPVSIQFSETLCIGAAIGPGQCPDANKIYLIVQDPQSTVDFAPVSELTISNDIYIKANGGSGMISDVTNGLPTPEPGVSLLSFSGLLALGLMAGVRARGAANLGRSRLLAGPPAGPD